MCLMHLFLARRSEQAAFWWVPENAALAAASASETPPRATSGQVPSPGLKEVV